jgi:hypothetical protein
MDDQSKDPEEPTELPQQSEMDDQGKDPAEPTDQELMDDPRPSVLPPVTPERQAELDAQIEEHEVKQDIAVMREEEEIENSKKDPRWMVDEEKTKGIFLSHVRLDQLFIMQTAEYGGARARSITQGAVYDNIRRNGWYVQAGSIKIVERWTDWQKLKDNGTIPQDAEPKEWFNEPEYPRFNPGDMVDVTEDPFFEYRSFWVCDGNHRISACQALVAARKVSDRRVLDLCIMCNVNVCVFVCV